MFLQQPFVRMSGQSKFISMPKFSTLNYVGITFGQTTFREMHANVYGKPNSIFHEDD